MIENIVATPEMGWLAFGMISLASAIRHYVKHAEKKEQDNPCDGGTDCFVPEDRTTAERTDANVIKLCKKNGIEPIT